MNSDYEFIGIKGEDGRFYLARDIAQKGELFQVFKSFGWDDRAKLDALVEELYRGSKEIFQVSFQPEPQEEPSPEPEPQPEPAPDGYDWGTIENSIFVSNSGSDNNPGTYEKPMATLKAAAEVAVMKGAHLSLHAGSTFDLNVLFEGEMPMADGSHIRAYGVGARPIIRCNNFINFFKGSMSGIVLLGLDIRAATPGYHSAIRILKNCTALSIINCDISGFQTNLIIQAEYGPIVDTHIQGCVIRDAFAAENGHSQGLYAQKVNGLSIYNCVFDHNGWSKPDRSDATIFNHNIYVQYDSKNVEVTGCLIKNASSHGLQLRCGGIVGDNYFIDCPLAVLIGHQNPDATREASYCLGNIVQGGGSINQDRPRSWGIEIKQIDCVVEDNVVMHAKSPIGPAFLNSDASITGQAHSNTYWNWNGWGQNPEGWTKQEMSPIDVGDGDLREQLQYLNNAHRV